MYFFLSLLYYTLLTQLPYNIFGLSSQMLAMHVEVSNKVSRQTYHTPNPIKKRVRLSTDPVTNVPVPKLAVLPASIHNTKYCFPGSSVNISTTRSTTVRESSVTDCETDIATYQEGAKTARCSRCKQKDTLIRKMELESGYGMWMAEQEIEEYKSLVRFVELEKRFGIPASWARIKAFLCYYRAWEIRTLTDYIFCLE